MLDAIMMIPMTGKKGKTAMDRSAFIEFSDFYGPVPILDPDDYRQSQ